jgi:nucleoside-diphosphate-sugar epimerase
VADVVRANLLAAGSPQAAGQVFNIGTGRQTSINQLFETLGRIFEVELEPVYEVARAGDIIHSYANPARARDILGWSAQVGFEEGLRQLVESL